MTGTPSHIEVDRGNGPLLVSFPHTGTEIPAEIEDRLVSPWRARKDTDWWIERLYDFADKLGATVVRTGLSRTVIDVNRDPSGASLYPGQATTGLCPDSTFDGEPLYRPGEGPSPAEVEARRERYFAPYHGALRSEIARLRARHRNVVVYDCHSIRSSIPRLFPGELPVFNIGTNGGASCSPELSGRIAKICEGTGEPTVVDGRFRGGWITRSLGHPASGVHALQMELACRAYLAEPPGPVDEDNWPTPYDDERAAMARSTLRNVLEACIGFASARA